MSKIHEILRLCGDEVWMLWMLFMVVVGIISVYKKTKLKKNTEDIANEDR